MNERRLAKPLFGSMSMVCAAVLAAPVLAAASHPAAASLLYMLFAPLCHQIPERSFHLLGFPLAVCVRCSGIYLGIWLVTLLALNAKILVPRRPMSSPSRLWTIIAACVLAADVATELAGLHPPISWLRFATGLLAGVAGGGWVVYSVRLLREEMKNRAEVEHLLQTDNRTRQLEPRRRLARILG